MRFTIRQTMAGLFLGLAIVTGIQGAITLVALRDVESGIGALSESQLPAVIALQEIDNAVSRIREAQYRLVLSEPVERLIADNLLTLSELETELSGARGRYEALVGSVEERFLYDRFAQTWSEYQKLTASLGTLVQSGGKAEAARLVLSPWLRILYKSVEDKLHRNMISNGQRARAGVSANLDLFGRAKIAIFGAVAFAAVLACFAMLLSYIRVIRPLALITRTMKRLASGDQDTAIEFAERRDEIGAMAAALRVFRNSLIRTSQAEDATRRTQLFVENIAATTPDGIVGLNDDGTVTFWNAAAERLLGYPAEEMIGQSIDRLIPGARGDGPINALDCRHSLVGKTVETEVTHKTGEIIPAELSLGRWTQGEDVIFCAILRDIRVRKQHEDALYRLAHHDPLTDLPNRTVLTDRIEETLRQGRSLTLLMADLDHFKQVNDVLGHRTGDALLCMAAERLVNCCSPADTVTRIGGDEFVLLLADVSDPLKAAATAEAVIASLSEPFCLDARTIHLGASVGMALAPAHGHSPDELLSCADMALYAAKAGGRHGYRLFVPELRNAANNESACRQELRSAVANTEFVLFYQPQFSLRDGALVGAEALIRWMHPTRGLLPPAQFIDTLESSPFASEVGDWVIRTACRQAAEWRRSGFPAFRMGVNLSSAQFRSGDFAARVRTILREFDLPGSALEIEITEKIILHHDENLVGPLRELRDCGVSIAFDDFGTGYASLSLLKRFPLDRLKIDQSFVRSMVESPEDTAIIRAILQLGQSLNLQVIAEGIETEDQRNRLERKGCQEGQGYLFGRPMPALDFMEKFGRAGLELGLERGAA